MNSHLKEVMMQVCANTFMILCTHLRLMCAVFVRDLCVCVSMAYVYVFVMCLLCVCLSLCG